MRTMEEQSLSDRMSTALVESKFDSRPEDFCPQDQFEASVTQEAIARELESAESDDDPGRQDLVRWIHQNARKIFAIMIVCSFPSGGILKAMRRLRARQFNDERLPISDPNSNASNDEREAALTIWEDESLTQRKDFYKKQWMFITPVFSETQFHHDLQPLVILPFTNRYSEVRNGGFSSVCGFEVHPAHRYPGYGKVAIKEIQLNGATTSRDDKNEVDKEWEKEARALQDINVLGHEHIIRCLAAIRRGNNRYFMFPWANSNLKEFWKETKEQVPSLALIRASVQQIYQLSDALYHLHNFEPRRPTQSDDASGINPPVTFALEGRPVEQAEEFLASNIRHGDLKPDNILRFLDNVNDSRDVGKLIIADMGLAKHHVIFTQDRTKATGTKHGTALYEPPEAKNALGPRSRLYDVWSMGCIIFEYTIWLLYGYSEIEKLHEELKEGGFQYFENVKDRNGTKTSVHTVIKRWMQHIKTHDPECKTNSAINDLLELVEKKLLAIDLPPHRPSAVGGTFQGGPGFQQPDANDEIRSYRVTAEVLRENMKGIVDKLANESYAFTGKPRDNVVLPGSIKLPSILSHTPRNTGIMNTDYRLPSLDQWEFPVDEVFANKALVQLGAEAFRPQRSVPTTLCDRCKSYNFRRGGFVIDAKREDMMDGRSRNCGLCKILWDVHIKSDKLKDPKVRFMRDASTLKISGSNSLPVLSLLRGPEPNSFSPIQLGLPELLQPGTPEFFRLISLWLQSCDDDHIQCSAPEQIPLPTRLIDVGTNESPELRLLETREVTLESSKYIALSHRWGDESEEKPHFSTLRKDQSGRGRELAAFKSRIPEDELPATFKDAVVTARTLNVRYLWIDSLCIVQGDDGDFKEESKHMETVFSCAYCVLAASRATNQYDGFLKQLKPRKYITLQPEGEKPLYVCEWIDDFSKHVLEGSLNQRGWVLQERALARRTIFFTEKQAYFECGQGIRCQSLTKMQHNMVDFLGDPKFPDKAMNSKRGLKIVYFQDLYKQYSRLEFTRIEDRPFAIRGLENRLRTAYKTKGGHGIFDDGQGKGLFHRSLLWQRSEAPEGAPIPWLSRISFPPERNISVPTWSWMAYQGGIDYLAPPFDKTDWETHDIQPPWSVTGGIPTNGSRTKLIVTVRDFNVAGWRPTEAKLVYDTDRQRPEGTRRIQCVVVAKSKDGKEDAEKRYHVLLVEPTDPTTNGEKAYERVGAGFMLGNFIMRDKPSILGVIQ